MIDTTTEKYPVYLVTLVGGSISESEPFNPCSIGESTDEQVSHYWIALTGVLTPSETNRVSGSTTVWQHVFPGRSSFRLFSDCFFLIELRDIWY
jgi:hypothetical protein